MPASTIVTDWYDGWVGAQGQRRSILSTLVIGYVALLPYQIEAGTRMNFSPADVCLVLILVLAMGRLKYRPAAWSPWHFAVLVIFAVGSLVAVLRVGALERYEALNKDAGLFLPFLSYVAIVSSIDCWDDLRLVLRVFTLAVVLENAVAVAAFLLAYFLQIPDPFARYGGMRLSGTMLDPNAYGGLLVSAFVVCEGASWGPAPLLGVRTLWFSRLTLILGILFTFSRSAWVALAAGLIVLGVLRAAIAMRFLAIVLGGAPALFVLMGHRFVPIFRDLASRPKQVEGRFELIDAALQAFSRHPFLGGGIGSFRLAEGEIAHNSAMWFLADFGIVGLAVFLGFVGWFAARGWFAYRFAGVNERSLVLALLAGHAAMFGLATGIEAFYQRHWWLLFGLIASSYWLVLVRSDDPAIRTGVRR